MKTLALRLMPAVLGFVAAFGAARPAAAQDELRLRRAFEGKRATILIDMPASQEGIDLFPGTGRPLDFQKYSGRIKKYGVALKEGERSIITKIKVKDDNIEVHLGGGGYGTFGDIFNQALTTNGADSGAAQQLQKSNERSQRAASGSRFNLRFPNGITPEDLEPPAVEKALAEYLTVSAGAGKAVAAKAEPERETGSASAPAPAAAPEAGPKQPKKGMQLEEVETIWGKPTSSRANGPVTTHMFAGPSGSGEVDAVNGVVVDVRVRPAGAAPAGPHKGMSVEELEQVAGKPVSTKSTGSMTTNKYRWQDGTLEADVVNGIVVAYRISSS